MRFGVSAIRALLVHRCTEYFMPACPARTRNAKVSQVDPDRSGELHGILKGGRKFRSRGDFTSNINFAEPEFIEIGWSIPPDSPVYGVARALNVGAKVPDPKLSANEVENSVAAATWKAAPAGKEFDRDQRGCSGRLGLGR